MAKKRQTTQAAQTTPVQKPLVEISEDEQWRLIEQTGVLRKISDTQKPGETTGNVESLPLADEIFNAVAYIIPLTSFLIMMDILIHQQYAKQPTAGEVAGRLFTNFPILSIFVFYTTRHKANPRMQLALFILSLGVGPRMIWLINHGSWLVNIRQCPQFATIWLYTVIQLNLNWAVLTLVMIGAWAWFTGMKLVP
ncbi:uncharacterized protein BJ212DRAFT_1014169 [Suillus subaureus]|uniref:DUF7719 domain-containing protein n=1 Tax=Suillus subaureus TaxID=48587 RepID=A0A9P7JFL2_9AGAM|nr:uncharacterized protein BJ212DRAFT_1014169 [Suillus subaureus]KAG1820275.1 hypothetical protein BJ212DRAFT_1014169 [Suillus subaureus]